MSRSWAGTHAASRRGRPTDSQRHGSRERWLRHRHPGHELFIVLHSRACTAENRRSGQGVLRFARLMIPPLEESGRSISLVGFPRNPNLCVRLCSRPPPRDHVGATGPRKTPSRSTACQGSQRAVILYDLAPLRRNLGSMPARLRFALSSHAGDDRPCGAPSSVVRLADPGPGAP
jgi:hypothetical protein